MQLKFRYTMILKICQKVTWSCKYQGSNYSRDQCFLFKDDRPDSFLQKKFSLENCIQYMLKLLKIYQN